MTNRPLPALWILTMALAAAACGGKATAVPPPSVTPGVEYVSQEEIVGQLRGNAAQFRYSIGRYGGSVTYGFSTMADDG